MSVEGAPVVKSLHIKTLLYNLLKSHSAAILIRSDKTVQVKNCKHLFLAFCQRTNILPNNLIKKSPNLSNDNSNVFANYTFKTILGTNDQEIRRSGTQCILCNNYNNRYHCVWWRICNFRWRFNTHNHLLSVFFAHQMQFSSTNCLPGLNLFHIHWLPKIKRITFVDELL